MATESEDVSIKKRKISDFQIQTLHSKTKSSSCWKHFGKLVWENEGKKKHVLTDQVFCEVCLNNAHNDDPNNILGMAKIKSYSANVSTGNLIRHLKEEHNISDPEKQKKASVNIKTFFAPRRPPTSRDVTQNNKWLLARDLAIWFCRSLMPFDSVGDEGMLDFFQKHGVIINPEDMPSRTTVSRDALQDVYDSLVLEVQRITATKVQHVAITTDLWSDSYRRRNYITFTLHFIDENMVLNRFTLDTIFILEKKTGERIKEEIEAVRERFGLANKQVFLVTDSGSNVKKAASLIPDVTSHFCLGHGLHNLVMVDGVSAVPSIDTLIKKCKKIAKSLRFRAPELEKEAEKEQQKILISLLDPNMSSEMDDSDSDTETEDDDIILPCSSAARPAFSAAPTIKTACKTRWHSVLTMLESLSHPNNKAPINNLLGRIAKHRLKVTDDEWHIIQQLIQVLGKIRTAVEIISSDSNCTINVALVLRNEIENVLKCSEDNELIAITAFKNKMLDRLDHRFPITEVLIAASLLDPRFQKLKTIDNYLECQHLSKPEFISRYVTDQLQLRNIDVGPTSYQEENPSEPSTSRGGQSDLLLNLATKYSEDSSTFTSPIESEAWKYFCSASANDVTNGILQYWKDRKNVYPWLYATAQAILSIPATSTPSERVFSVAGLTITAKRSRLHQSRVNKIIFIHDNYSNLNKL